MDKRVYERLSGRGKLSMSTVSYVMQSEVHKKSKVFMDNLSQETVVTIVLFHHWNGI